jgi:ribonuclease P protein component
MPRRAPTQPSKMRRRGKPLVTSAFRLRLWCCAVLDSPLAPDGPHRSNGASAAGTEEAMSEANLPTEQPKKGEASRLPPPDVDPSGRQAVPATTSAAGRDRIWRVEHRATFQDLRRGRRRRAGPITISWVAGDPAEPPRVAFTIGRQVGSAVLRNRLRRRLRMLMREAAPRLRPGAYLVGAAPPAAALSYADLRAHVLEALNQLENT